MLTHVLITTGSPQGIGAEVSMKALSSISASEKVRYTILTTTRSQKIRLDRQWKARKIKTSEISKWESRESHFVGVVEINTSPAALVRIAAKYCLRDPRCCLVTAPMRKLKNGDGHTEILKELSQNQSLRMGFIGKKFNLLLATTHIPLKDVDKSLTTDKLRQTLGATIQLHKMTGSEKDPIGVLGLNPHAGENGVISRRDRALLGVLKRQRPTVKLSPLLSPDAAFMSGSDYRTILAWYHDQGLIPFKILHGLKHGIQVTLGLPFIRTSVDHGTAEDIKGRGIAEFRSMKMAIEKAVYLNKNFSNSEYE